MRGAEPCHSSRAAGPGGQPPRAARSPDQRRVNESFAGADILFIGRSYRIDEAPGAYKAFDQVIDSAKQAGLASQVARLVIKDGDKADD